MKNKRKATGCATSAQRMEVTCKQLEDIIEFLPYAIFVVDNDRNVLIWNQAIERMTGISKAEIIGKHYYSCGIPFYGEARPFALELLNNHDQELASKYTNLKTMGAAISAEVFAPNLYGGKGAYLFINASTLFDAEGRVTGAVQSMLDITVRKRALEALEESEQKFKGISSSAQDAIIMLDGDGDIVYWNPAAEKIFGYSEAEALGKHAHSLLAPGMTADAYSSGAHEFKLSGRGPVVNRTLELIAKRKDGTEFPIELSVSALNLKGQWHAIGIVRDITEHKRVKDSLVRARMEAEEANKAKSEFLANMSHELRTPLNSINGFSELILEGFAGELSDQQRDYIDHIHLSGQHLLSLINDILDLSKVEAGKMELDLNRIIISDLVQSTIGLSREKAVKHGLKISYEIAEGADYIVADVRLIKQVLFNLLSNAVKFTPDGGRIGMRVRKTDEDFMEFSVSDTGIGISADDQKKLFQPFKQLDSSYNKKFAGTGLGLSLCRKIVELHGGRIWLESEEGRGSTFTFAIPRLRDVKEKHHS